MNKGCPWILLLLIAANAANLASCVGFNREEWPLIEKQRIFRRPLLNDEYSPPIPVFHPSHYRNARHSDPADEQDWTEDRSLDRRSWTPLVYADQLPHPVRQVFVQPLTYRGRLSVKASSPVAVTKEPDTFDIPLRKSIRVSQNVPRQPSIQTTGYIKDVVVKKVPAHRLTPKPKYTILVDNVKQTTAQSALNVPAFEDAWIPKRITTLSPTVRTVKDSRRLKPVPFTQFSDSMIVGEGGVNNNVQRPPIHKDNAPIHRGQTHSDSRDQNYKQTNGGSTPKLTGENGDGKGPYFVQSVVKPNNGNQGGDVLLSDVNTFNQKNSPPNFKSMRTNGDSKDTGRNKIFIGVEYADSKLQGVKTNNSNMPKPETNNGNDGNVGEQQKPNSQINNNKMQNGNIKLPEDVQMFAPQDGDKISKFIKSSDEKKTHTLQTLDKSKATDVKTDPGTRSDISKSFKQNMKDPEAVDIAQSSSRAPYTDLHHNPNSKEFPEDTVYFPPIFPDSHKIPGRNTTSTVKSSSIASTKTFVNNDRLIEFITKTGSNTSAPNHANSHRRNKNPPKSETTNDFVSHSYYSPTPPSLITVSSDNGDVRDSERTRSKTNRTDNYILQMKPSLFPEKPSTNRPRKPNIKITSAMLAGILIAALIFLGFLTGTMVFVFHQLKFRSRGSKKAERHKKRATVYAPEYLDEAFAGNTYIHNNIFLPNPQNLEERLSPELDTSFSVDSDETTPAADHPTTSSSHVHNTRNKSIHSRHQDISSD